MSAPRIPRSAPLTTGSCLAACALVAFTWLVLVALSVWVWRAIHHA